MAPSVDGVPIPTIAVLDAIARVADGALLIDVREQEEWDAGHAPSAQFLPLSGLKERVGELPTDAQLLVVCHAGGRSARAVEFLLAEGYDVVNVVGGMSAWTTAGGPLSATT